MASQDPIVIPPLALTGYEPGTIVNVFHKEPQFPPGHVVPYQVKLDSGTTVYVPADSPDFVMAAEVAEEVTEKAAALEVK